MIEAALQGISDLLSWSAMGWLIIGVISGLFIAVIPGIGSVSMLSVLIPFTFAMDPMMAFALLIGFIAVGCTSDAIPAILLGIPGSASSQATIIDGYAMTRKGEAGRALGASFTASVLGGIFGAVILSLMIPVMRPFALMFGASEFLVMSLWGVSMIAVLSGSSPLKGLAVGGFGLLLGALGTDPNLGFARWTFSNSYFLEGISLTLVGIGIFAVPELISLAVRRTTVSEVPIKGSLYRGQLQGAKDVIKNPGVFLRSSGLGTLIGAIPGIGSAVVDWLAYGLTVQTAKDKSKFGKGDVRGVIGVDGANNAVYGGSMIPTLAFGIPGSVSMAFLLIVMFAHGVQAGSGLITNPSSLSLVYFLIWGLAIANIIGALICFAGSGLFVKVTRIPYYYLFGLLVPFLFLASYYNKNSIYDLYMLIILSIFGYAFKQYGWPRAPLLVGIVLSRSVEANLSVSLSVFGMSWVYRPIVLVLWVVIIAGLYFSYKALKSSKLKPNTGATSNNEVAPSVEKVESENKRNKFKLFIESGSAFTVLLLIILVSALIPALSWPALAARFPLVIGIFVLVVLVIQLINELKNSKKHQVGMHFDLPPDDIGGRGETLRRSSIIFAWIIGLVILVYLLGLAISLPLFAFVYMLSVGKVSILRSLALTVCLTLIIVGFAHLAGIYWNTGLLLSMF
ncbi:tripartite tricarboxylate transporter permease [Bacillus sp. Marseille-P3661]|uniref:tripartite tricarboxylate transporter permease n=1 Tax=Bacillus sp. Marseille-P3661 TaxID=1936234 RepID=UPI000C84EF4A|nr:tripartite tricarboxylate transporter permease [Bacillus sp. Marseille-P3661]